MTDLGTQYYVIENYHADPARILAGPVDSEQAKDIAVMQTPTADVMGTLWLVYNVRENDYQVAWPDDVEKPGPLKQATGDGDRQGDD
jgi:hypothetical protein